jgi:replicative DNA helicase
MDAVADGSPPLSARSHQQSLPPSDEVSEQGFLGAGLVRNEIFEGAIGSLMPEHFADSLHGRIYSSALALIARGVKANPVTLGSEFEQRFGTHGTRRSAVSDATRVMYAFKVIGAGAWVKSPQR